MKLKKWQFVLIISAGSLLIAVFFAFIIVVGFWFLFPTPKWERQRMAEYYRSGIGCSVIEAYITENDLTYEDGILYISFNEAKILTVGHDVYWETYNGAGRVYEAGVAKLQENGFFDAVKVGAIITVNIEFKIWWDGWGYCPIMEIQIGNKIYLDNETGVEEFVYWILNEMY